MIFVAFFAWVIEVHGRLASRCFYFLKVLKEQATERWYSAPMEKAKVGWRKARICLPAGKGQQEVGRSVQFIHHVIVDYALLSDHEAKL